MKKVLIVLAVIVLIGVGCKDAIIAFADGFKTGYEWSKEYAENQIVFDTFMDDINSDEVLDATASLGFMKNRACVYVTYNYNNSMEIYYLEDIVDLMGGEL